MGGFQVSGRGTGDDGYDEDGYDESQRAEILETTREGPHDDAIQTDLNPDLGEELDDSDDDDISMSDREIGEEDRDAALSSEDRDEDEVQAEFDDGTSQDDDLDDSDDDALSG